MNKTNYPPEIQAFINRYNPFKIGEYSRYKNIYELDFQQIEYGDWKKVYIRVEKDRMSDSRIH